MALEKLKTTKTKRLYFKEAKIFARYCSVKMLLLCKPQKRHKVST